MSTDLGTFETEADKQREEAQLLASIAAQYEGLKSLLDKCSDWGYEDPVYRFYHQSFKVYHLQEITLEIVKALAALMPERPLNKWLLEIVEQGTGKAFANSHNYAWTENTRDIVEAFFHTRFMLEMVCKYGKLLTKPPSIIPSGWGAVLYLFNLR